MATILVVDDEPFIREIIQATLGREGYTVLVAENGEQALQLCDAQQGEIDVLVTDLKMPVMDGIQLARRIKASMPSLRVVIISGFGEGKTLIESGFLPEDIVYLEKPFSLNAIEDTVRKVLEAGSERLPDQAY